MLTPSLFTDGGLACSVSSSPRNINLQLKRLQEEIVRTSSAHAKAIEMQEKVDVLTSQAEGHTRAKEKTGAEVFVCLAERIEYTTQCITLSCSFTMCSNLNRTHSPVCNTYRSSSSPLLISLCVYLAAKSGDNRTYCVGVDSIGYMVLSAKCRIRLGILCVFGWLLLQFPGYG